jgi:hypothetical protein
MTQREFLNQHVDPSELGQVTDPELDWLTVNGETPAEAVIRFIRWGSAPQGYQYWAGVWAELNEKERQSGRPKISVPVH